MDATPIAKPPDRSLTARPTVAHAPSFETLAFWMVVLSTFALASLMPMQNDSWWHLRCGQLVMEQGVVDHDPLSYTSPPDHHWPMHEWLTEVLALWAWNLGGLPLLTLAAAACATGAVALMLALTVGPVTLRVAGVVVALPWLASLFSVRPQVVSMLLLMVTAWQLTRFSRSLRQDAWRIAGLAALFALWANLHGGVVMGGMAMVGATALAALAHRDRLRSLLVATGCCGAATALTPLHVHIYLFPLEGVRRARGLGVTEWQAAPPLSPEGLTFWLSLAALVGLLAWRWRKPLPWPALALAGAALVLAGPATMTVRSIAPFLLLAIPAITRLARGQAPIAQQPVVVPPTSPAAARAHRRVLGGAMLLALALPTVAYAGRWPMLGWDPVSPAAQAAIAQAPGPIYTTYDDGGFLLWFTPQHRTFVDSRDIAFPEDFLHEVMHAERTGAPLPLVQRWNVRSAILNPRLPVARALREAGWAVAFDDGRWTVLLAPG